MPRLRKLNKTKDKAIIDDLDSNNNDILLSPDDDNTFGNNTRQEAQDHIFLNVATTSKASTNITDLSSDIPPNVKHYIDAAFERQTLELKTLFQSLNDKNSNLFPSNTQHDPDTDSDANTHQYGNTARQTNLNKQPIPKTNQHASKRPSPNPDDNSDSNNIKNKKLRTTQGEYQHTNFTSLTDIQGLLHDHTHNGKPNIMLPPPIPDLASSRILPHSSLPALEQDDSVLPHHHTRNFSFDVSWPLHTYNPINYKDDKYDPKSEADQIVDPIARETEKTRLWWSENFKKEGWNRILNKPSKPANVPRSIWQTIAYNHFMKLTLLSQSSVENFTKANNNTLEANIDDDARTVVIINPSQTMPFNYEANVLGQTRRHTNSLYFPTWHEWYIAWKFYIDLVLIIYSHRVGEMHGYISILSEFAKDFNLYAVMRYDRDRRIKLVERRGSTLLDREPSVEGRHFTAAAARVQYIPKQTNSYNRSSNFRSSRTIFHEGTPICREFNRKDGCKRDICRFQHVCFACRLKSYGEVSCFRLHPSKSTQQQQNPAKPNKDTTKP